MAGIFEGMDLVKESPEQAAAWMADAYGMKPDEVMGMMADAHATNFAENVQFFVNASNPTNFERTWKNASYVYRTLGRIDSPVPFDQVMDFTFIKKLETAGTFAHQKDESKPSFTPAAYRNIPAESPILTQTIRINFFPNSANPYELARDEFGNTIPGKLYDPNVDPTLEEVARLSGQFERAIILVEGHTDSSMKGRVPVQAVKDLSLARAEAIKQGAHREVQVRSGQVQREGQRLGAPGGVRRPEQPRAQPPGRDQRLPARAELAAMVMRSNRHRRRRSPIGLIVLALLVGYLMWKSNRQSSPPAAPPSVTGTSDRAARDINPITQMIKPRANVPRRDGVAIAVLVDVSGSMRRDVRGQQGKQAKIEIARSSVLDLVRQTGAFAQQHPEQLVELGLYEFSSRKRPPSCRVVLPLGPPNLDAATAAVKRMVPEGGTPIGDAIIQARRDLDATGLRRQHILVVTDGENTQGYSPADVAQALARLPDDDRPALYLIAFDTAAEQFEGVRQAGGLVLGASSQSDLQQTLDYVLTGKILAEQPE